MGLSTERKVFLGLFIVAGGAFLLDQAILGPSSAEASPIDVGLELLSESIADPSKVINSETLNELSAASVLNERLEAVSAGINDQASLNGLFTDPAIVMNAIESGVQPESARGAPAVTITLPSLSAVMPSKSGGAAVLNGVLVRAGDVSQDGFRLITVQKRSITIEKSGKKYELELPVLGG